MTPACRFAPAAALALSLVAGAALPAAAQAPATKAPAAEPAREEFPKGKWPWFKRYRNQRQQAAAGAPAAPSAEAVREAPPAAPPAPEGGVVAPSAPAPRERPPSALAQRRQARASRAATAAAAAPEGSVAEAQVAAAADGRGRTTTGFLPMPRELARIDRHVRRELGLAPGGSPAVAGLTRQVTALRDLEPLQARLLALPPGLEGEAEARSSFCAALLSHGLEAAAAAECLAALSLRADLVPAWNNLATSLRRLGLLGLAEDALDAALLLDPSSGIARFNRAMVLEARGKRLEAEQEYVRALELDPSLWLPNRNPLVVGNPDARRALHDLYLKRNAHGGVLVDTGN